MSSKRGLKRGDNSLGERIFTIRDEERLTLTEFAQSLDMKSGGYISDLEKGVKSNLSGALINKFKEVYNVCPKWLLTGDGMRTYPTFNQINNGVKSRKKSSGEDIHMLGSQIIELVDQITRLKIRIEKLESLSEGNQKKKGSTK